MIRTWARVLLFLLVVGGSWVGVPVAEGATVYTKTNGTIQIKLNQLGYPMITEMSINGLVVMPHDNAGADFQMTTRSAAGNDYNPTQGGNCTGKPSRLSGVLPNWSNVSGISTANGILLGIDPLNYGTPNSDPDGCSASSSDQPLPYNFAFGVTLGDGSNLAKETMVLDLSVQREISSTAQTIQKNASELPVAYFKTSILPYAYYSEDGVSFYPLTQNGTHDTRQWTTDVHSPLINVNKNGQVIYLSTVSNAHTSPTTGFGVAFYAHPIATCTSPTHPLPFPCTGMIASHRIGGTGQQLTMIAMTGGRHTTDNNLLITDFGWHTVRRLVIVGFLDGVRAAISQAKMRFPNNTDWGNWE